MEEHRAKTITGYGVPRPGSNGGLKLFHGFVLLSLRIEDSAQPEVGLDEVGSFLKGFAVMTLRHFVFAELRIIATQVAVRQGIVLCCRQCVLKKA